MRKVCTIFALIILFFSANTNLDAQQANPDQTQLTYFDYNEMGARKALAGDYAAAHALFTKSLELRPDCTRCRYNLAWVFVRLNRHEDTIRELKQVLKLEPNDTKSLKMLGDSYIKMHAYSESLPYLRRALDESDAQPDVNIYLSYGHALIKLDRSDEALVYLEKAVKLEPGNFEAHNNLGYALFLAGRTQEAYESLKTALALNPHHATIYNNLGRVYEKFGKEAKAFEYYKLAIEIEPNHAEARFNLGFAELRRGNRAAAYQQLDVLQKIDVPAAEKLRDALQEKFIVKVSDRN